MHAQEVKTSTLNPYTSVVFLADDETVLESVTHKTKTMVTIRYSYRCFVHKCY